MIRYFLTFTRTFRRFLLLNLLRRNAQTSTVCKLSAERNSSGRENFQSGKKFRGTERCRDGQILIREFIGREFQFREINPISFRAICLGLIFQSLGLIDEQDDTKYLSENEHRYWGSWCPKQTSAFLRGGWPRYPDDWVVAIVSAEFNEITWSIRYTRLASKYRAPPSARFYRAGSHGCVKRIARLSMDARWIETHSSPVTFSHCYNAAVCTHTHTHTHTNV